MIHKKILMTAGADKLSDILLELHEIKDKCRDFFDIFFVSLDKTPQKLIITLRGKLDLIKQSRQFISYKKSDGFSDQLDHLRLAITEVQKTFPSTAMELMLEFEEL